MLKFKHLKLHGVYWAAQQRCANPNDKKYARYGGRGITFNFSTPWEFQEWAFANGYEEGLQLDRIDNNKGYSEQNCRFITNRANSCNKQRASKYGHNIEKHRKKFRVRFLIDGKNKTVASCTTNEEAIIKRDNYVF